MSAFDAHRDSELRKYDLLVQGKRNACDGYTVGEVKQWHPSRGSETFTAFYESNLHSGVLRGFFAERFSGSPSYSEC